MSKNLFSFRTSVSWVEREKMLGQKGSVVWLTGLSGSGKSTIAILLERELFRLGKLAYTLDGDNIRSGLNSDLGFEDEDRRENIRRVSEVVALFADAGLIAIVSFISPFAKDRHRARIIAKDHKFFEIYINAPLDVCENRDPKGLYVKARSGLIPDFTGISSPYEAPLNPDLEIRTDLLTPEKSVEKIIFFLKENGVI